MHKGFVLMNCDLGAEEYIIEELCKIPEVSHAYVTFGAYDIFAEIDRLGAYEFSGTFWTVNLVAMLSNDSF